MLILGFSLTSYSQSYFVKWDFNSIVNDASTATGVNTPSLGVDNFNSIGGVTNSFGSGNVNDLNTTDNSSFQTTQYPELGLNPKTGGVQFNVSTVGFNKAQLEFYQRLSNTAANTWVLQYTLDKTGVSTGGIVVWADATTYTFVPAPTGTGDTWHLRTFDFSAIGGLNNNATAGFRVVSDFDPITGNYLAARSTSTYNTGGNSRFDLVSMKEAAGTSSIVTASNYQIVSENVGTVNVPVTYTNANNADAKIVFEVSGYSSGFLGTDFNWTTNDTLTIPANFNGLINFPITIIDDVQAERAETIILKMKSYSNALVSVSQYYQIIYVKDNDYQAPVGTNELNMNLMSSFSNGAAGANSAEIVVYDSTNYRLYIANSIAAKIDIVDFSNPSTPVLLNSVSIADYGNINSLAVHNGVVALAIENTNAQLNGSIVFMDQNGGFISQVAAGAMPDMITFNKDFTKIITANEGEPNSTYSVDPEGSITIVDLTPGYAALTNTNATTISLTQFNGQEVALRAQGIRIFSTSASVAQDLEPEYIAISDDNTKAYVSLQENNAMLVIDLATAVIEEIRALGYSDYSTGNGMDASDRTGQILITSLPVKGAYMPDAIAYSTIGGQGYVFSANEGDSREFGAVVDAARISTLNLDPTVFPDQLILKNNNLAGRLSGLRYSGDTDNDGDLDEIHVMGGRSFSIWNAATGALVFDSKDLIEQIIAAHPVYSTIFNSSNSIGTPSLKNRSDDKGPEPEGITTAKINGDNYVFVSLERVGGAMIFNVNDPVNPVYVGYRNNRSTTVSGPDLGAEGMIFISAEASPNGNAMLILANEVSSSLSIYQVNTCAEIAGAEINATTNVLCEGESTEYTIQGSNGSSVQWYFENQPIPGATSTNLMANQSGEYEVFISSDLYACNDTSTSIQLVVNPLPLVTIVVSDSVICVGESVVLNGQGAETYIWNNSTVNNTSFTPSVSDTYSVVGVDANGCKKSASVNLTVNPLPIVVANVTKTEICEGQKVVFSGSGAQTYTWNNSIVNGLSIMLMNSGVFDLVGIDANACSNTDNVSVTVKIVPNISLGVDTTICSNNAPLNLKVDGNYSVYNWSTGESTASIMVNQTASYSLKVTSTNGCTDSDTILVIIDSCLGLEDLSNTINVYPNPTSGNITMNFGNYISNGLVELYDGQGRLVLNIEVNGQNQIIDMTSFSKGVYTILVKEVNSIQQIRIIKE